VSTLSPTAYVVLGLVELCGPSTPYDLKLAANASVGYFWSLPHTQLYAEPEKLAAAGLLKEEREESGRRRKVYSLTPAGRKALDAWRQAPTGTITQLRDPGLLQLFFGADPGPLAEAQLAAHQERLREYEAILAQLEGPSGQRFALEAGIGHEREYVRFWRRLAAQD
jgi:DNA-binding PadR family transcriptional regulator